MPTDPSSPLSGILHARKQAEERLKYLRGFVESLLTIWARQIEALREHHDADVAQAAAIAAIGVIQLSRLVSHYAGQAAQSTVPIVKLSGALMEVDELVRALEAAQARSVQRVRGATP